MLLKSISSNLQGDPSKTIDDTQALHEMTTQAKESLNEFNKVKSACAEKASAIDARVHAGIVCTREIKWNKLFLLLKLVRV